jgi:hypothetical protein
MGHIEGIGPASNAGNGRLDIGCTLNFKRDLFDVKRASDGRDFLHFNDGVRSRDVTNDGQMAKRGNDFTQISIRLPASSAD